MDYPLNKSIDALDLDNVRGQFAASKEKGSEPDRLKASLERALRAKALSLGSSDADISAVEAFVQFIISLAKEEICPKTLTIQILQDIFDVSTTSRCAELFTIVETHIDTWKTSFFFDSCKNMVLRMCNDLLKRLSRTIDTTFCGRILILLAKSLPLNEKSGLNLTGQFNTQNVTIYDRESKEQLDDPTAQAPVDDDMEIGEIREHKDAGGSIPVDHNLYIKFWDLQRVFSNPNLLFESEQFKKFEMDIADLFGLFAAYKLEKPQRQREHSPSRAREATETNGMDEMKMEYKKTTVFDYNKSTSTSQSQMNGCSSKMEIDDKDSMDINGIDNTKNAPTSDHEPTFFAKYLTSQKLFPLQLADSQFRRYFLLQFLIVSNYLNSKARLKDVDLTAAQETSIKELTEKCYSLLRDTYPHGTHFADSVRKLLGRERQWSTWKNEGCPDLIAQLLNSSERKCAVFKRKPVSRHDANFIDLGNRELTRLWNIESNNLQACKNIERKCIPVLRQFLEEALDEMDPVQQVEEQYQSVNEEKYQWMASRFLLFNSDHYINCAVVQQDTSAKIPEELNPTATILRKAIQLTAEHMPELKSRAEQIQAHQKKLELEAKQAEEARLMKLAAKTRELEKRIKQEEEEQRAQQQQQQQAVQIKKEKEASNAGTNAGSYNEVKKEVAAELHNEQQHSPQKQSQNSSSRAHSPSTTKRSSERSSERQKPAPAPTTVSESVEKEETVPKKRVKREPPTENSNSSTASPSSSQRKREKEEPTPEHDQGGGGGHRSGTAVSSKKAEDKEARKSEADEKDRKSRKRHAEKSEERKSHSSVKGERKGGSSGRSRASSTDREHNHRGAVANENDRLKKRK